MTLPTISNDFTAGFSATLWVYPTAGGLNQALFDLDGNTSFNNNIILSRVGTTNDLQFTVFQGAVQGTAIVAHNVLALNAWQFIAVSMDSGGHVTLYKNGAVIATGTTFKPLAGIVRTNNFVGKSNDASRAFFAGGLDEVAFFATPLTTAQIQAEFAKSVFGTVNIDLLQNGALMQNIATAVPDNGSFSWTIPANLPLGDGYQVRVTANDATQPSGLSPQQFLVANNGHCYYVNDSSTAGDIYTTAPGNDANSGKDPSQPMATLAALLQAYPVGPGDTVYVDTGNYAVLHNIILDATHSGVTIIGPASGPGAVLNRGNIKTGSYVFQLQGAVTVTISQFTITGGFDGIHASINVGSTGLTVSNCTINGNATNGIFLDQSNNNAVLTGNTIFGDLAANGAKQTNGITLSTNYNTISGNNVFDHGGNGIADSGLGFTINGNSVFGNATGILASLTTTNLLSDRITVSNNIVRNNTTFGISAQGTIFLVGGDAVVTGNTVTGQLSTSGAGIQAQGVEVANNVVDGNYNGIVSLSNADSIHNNRLFNNSNAGVNVNAGSTVFANTIYSNNIGILGRNTFNGQVIGNLVYASASSGILIENSSASGGLIANNTVYQVSGSAVRLDTSAHSIKVRNNVLEVLAGFDIFVASDSQSGFSSDYNDLFIGTDPNARVGFYNNANQTTLANWQTATGQEAHSISSDPTFVNINGADNLLGYTQVNGVFADYGQDDNFTLSRGSPVIDRGDSWSGPATDIQGNAHQDDPGTSNLGTTDYAASTPSPQSFPSGGQSKNGKGNNISVFITLPFTFSFYGTNYTNVFASSEGFLQFAGSDATNDATIPAAKLLRDARILPLEANLRTDGTGNDIFADTSVANQITIRWSATNEADNSPANFAVTLFSNGNIRFDYGSGNTNLNPTIGISAGNNLSYQLVPGYNGASNLTNAPSVLFTQQSGVTDLGAYEFTGSSLNATPPAVLTTTPAVVATGGTSFSFTQLQVGFSKAVNAIDANAPAVYELRKAGSSGFGSADDVVFALVPSYAPSTNTVTLTATGFAGTNLPAGTYRFTIFSAGVGTIHDLSGNALDGDGDNIAGGNFVRTFSLAGAAPTVTSVAPSSGPLSGLTSVTITGNNLAAVTAVNFGLNAGTITSQTATQIVAKSPVGVAGSVDITVATAVGSSATSAADRFTYVAAPTVTGISPAGGPLPGGTVVTITGTNLLNATAVNFGGIPGAITSASATQIVAVSPPGVAGSVDVTVVTAGGVSATVPADQFVYADLPTVTALSFHFGPSAGGAVLTITGINLANASAVNFGGIIVPVISANANQITVTSPPTAAGNAVDVTVTTTGGTSAPTPVDHFTFVDAPVVTSVTPVSGPGAGGTVVIITGSNFGAASAVNFGSTAGTITANTGLQITAIAPAGVLGTVVDVTVVTGGGTSAVSAADHFAYRQPNSIVFTTGGQTLIAGQISNVITVQLLDGQGNPYLADSAGVTLTLSSTSTGGTFLTAGGQPIAGNTITIGQGASTASFEYQDIHPGNPTLTVTGQAVISVTVSTSAFVFNLGPATRLAITGMPSSAVAGGFVLFFVTAQDNVGNTIPTYSGVVHFSSTDGQAILPADATLTSGSGQFAVELSTPGVTTITATDTQATTLLGTSTPITVNAVPPGAATRFIVTASPGALTAGASVTVSITALDAQSHTATGYHGTVHFSSSDQQAGLPADATLTSGQGTFSVTLVTAGTQALTVADTANGSLVGSKTGISVTAASASHFNFTAPSASAAGNAFVMIVTALDSFGNTATGYGGTVSFNSSDPQAFLPSAGALNNGSGVFAAILKTAGSQTIAFADPNNAALGSPSQVINVSGLAADHFVVTLPPSAVLGGPVVFTVTAKDPFGNTDLNYAGTVGFSSSDSGAGLPPSATLTAGIGSFSATFGSTVSGTSGHPGFQSLTVTDVASTAVKGMAFTAVHGLTVTALAATPTGFTVTFDKPVDPTTITLWSAISSVSIVNGAGLPVRGSLLINTVAGAAANTSFSFNMTGTGTAGLLPPDTYTVTLLSGVGGVKDFALNQLDANDDGKPGDSFVGTFTITTVPQTVLSIPSFARGPNGAADIKIPNTGAGIPIALAQAANVTDVSFQLTYNPALLTITGALNSAAGTLTLQSNSGGVASFAFHSNTPLSGNLTLGQIVARVPDSAAASYKAKALLHLGNIVINGSTSVASVDGIQLVAYLGDVMGTGSYSSLDSAFIGRVAVRLDSGFKAFAQMDPALVADINGNGRVDSGDVTLINRQLVGITVPLIPTPPTGLSIAPVGPDPEIGLPATLAISPASTVTVPITIDTARPEGSTGMVESVLALRYDPEQLSVSPADISLGTLLTEGPGSWRLISAINAETGVIGLDIFSPFPIQTSAGGTLASIVFHVHGTPIDSTKPAVSLVEEVNPTGQRSFRTMVADTQGALVLHLGNASAFVIAPGAVDTKNAPSQPADVSPVTLAPTLPVTKALLGGNSPAFERVWMMPELPTLSILGDAQASTHSGDFAISHEMAAAVAERWTMDGQDEQWLAQAAVWDEHGSAESMDWSDVAIGWLLGDKAKAKKGP
ncbi:MAG TPA: IPT/TIG domain-containing protein [Gemmataceae bacterium]|nr:IPT/TIG domain-containing protein [Gemmataceae bacterium]